MKAATLLMLLALGLAACAGSERRVTSETRGEVVAVTTLGAGDPDRLGDDRLGAFVGGVGGGLIGALFGEGSGRALASSVGVVAGLFAGAAVENALEGEGALVTVRLDGEARSRSFRTGSDAFVPGEPVRLRRFSDGTAALVRG